MIHCPFQPKQFLWYLSFLVFLALPGTINDEYQGTVVHLNSSITVKGNYNLFGCIIWWKSCFMNSSAFITAFFFSVPFPVLYTLKHILQSWIHNAYNVHKHLAFFSIWLCLMDPAFVAVIFQLSIGSGIVFSWSKTPGWAMASLQHPASKGTGGVWEVQSCSTKAPLSWLNWGNCEEISWDFGCDGIRIAI